MKPEDPGRTDYPFSGAMFLLSHRPLDPPDPGVSVLSGDIGDAVATALDARQRDLEILGADVAAQCFQRGLVDEVLVYVLPVLLGDGVGLSAPAMRRTELEPLSSRRSGDTTILRFRVRKQGSVRQGKTRGSSHFPSHPMAPAAVECASVLSSDTSLGGPCRPE